MKSLRLAVLVVIVLACSSAAFAWPKCSGNWVQVPAGTSTANGAIVTENGQTFQCQQPTPPPPNPGNQQQTQNQQQSQTTTTTATGGSVNGSGNSTIGPISTVAKGGAGGSVKDSGNSTNTNTNNVSATGGAGGAGGAGGNSDQTQSAAATASDNGNGNGNNSNNSTTNVAAPKIPVATAVGTTVVPSNPCFKTYGGGFQSMSTGVSLGGGKIDGGCDAREYARFYAEMLHSRTAACKMLVSQKRSKKAGVTFADCMAQDPQPVVEVAPPAPAPVSPVNIYLPANTPVPAVAAVVPIAPPEYKTEITVTPEQLVGVCTFAKAISCKPENGPAVITVSSICKQMLEQAKKSLLANPGSVLLIVGNRNASEDRLTATSRANNVKKQLEAYGVPSSRLKAEVGTGTSRTVELILQPATK